MSDLGKCVTCSTPYLDLGDSITMPGNGRSVSCPHINEAWHRGLQATGKKVPGPPPILLPLSSTTPSYYQGDYVMRIIEDFHLDFLDGQVIKYILRSGNKGPALEDYEKAKWYLERKINNLKKT